MRTAAALTVLAVPSAMLTGSLATAFAVPGDSSTTDPSPTTTSAEARAIEVTTSVLTLRPGHGEPRSPVEATAPLMSECAPGQPGVLSLSWGGDSLEPTDITADPASGGISFKFAVPATAEVGSHTVEAVCSPAHGVPSNAFRSTSSNTFTVDPAEKPTLTLTSGYGPPGAQVAVSGTGFTCDTDLMLRWDDGSVLADQLSGTFTAHVSVPADASADSTHSITASCRDDPDSAVSQPFTVTPVAVSSTVTTGETQSVTEPTVSALPEVSEQIPPKTLPPPPQGGPPWWPITLITLIVAAVLTGATYFYRRARTRPAHVGAEVRAVPRFDTAPTVTVRETPAPGEVARSVGLVPHPDPGIQTFVEVSS